MILELNIQLNLTDRFAICANAFRGAGTSSSERESLERKRSDMNIGRDFSCAFIKIVRWSPETKTR